MAKYHQDEEIRVEGERYAGIVVKNNQVLLVHRIKEGYEYYVFPGGHRRQGESGEQAAIREIMEEAGIEVGAPRLAFEFKDHANKTADNYYLCQWVSGDTPHLTGEELEADPAVDLFDPMWVDISEINKLNVLPKFAYHWLIKYLHI